MKTRSAIVLAVVVGGAIFAVIVASRRPYLARQKLPDGTVLTLVALKVGNKHESPLATLSEKLAARLPVSWRAPLKLSKTPDATSCRVSSNYLTIWLTAEPRRDMPVLHVWVGDDRENWGVSEEFCEESAATNSHENPDAAGLFALLGTRHSGRR